MIKERTKRNSSKINLIISGIFHLLLVLAVVFFAAREGMLGKKLKALTVVAVPKEKKPEPPKAKPEEPKPEQSKPEEAPKVNVPQPKVETAVAPPPAAVDEAPAVAPAAVALPSFDFNDGAHQVQTINDPNGIYKALVEHTLRSRWNRPEDMEDDDFVAEVEVSIDLKGNIRDYSWLRGSGNTRWDKSVKEALAETKAISKGPPKGFPEKFMVRFDVESTRTEPIQLSRQ